MSGSPSLDLDAEFLTRRAGLVRLALLLVDDLPTAEDVVQDAFLGLHRNRGRVRNIDSVGAYLRRAVVNNARGVLRRRHRTRRYLPAIEVDSPGADIDLMLAEEHRVVLDGVRLLPPGQRAVVTLRYWGDMSDREIAQILGTSVGGVRSQASRALRKVRQHLEVQDG